jgi:hypothetical protein
MLKTRKPTGGKPRGFLICQWQAGERIYRMANVAHNWLERKPALEHLLPDLSPGRKERHGPCPFCGGEDRFIVFADSGRGWCRQCGWKGDALQLLRDRDGLSFLEAKKALGLDTYTAPAAKRQATIHSFALAVAKREYQAWQRRVFHGLIDHYRELSTECDIAEVGYRAIHRAPELYTPEERRCWTHRLATIYDRLATLEHDLDLMTYDRNEAQRFGWWRQESEARHG